MYNDSVTISRWQHWRELNRQLWRLGLIGVATLTLMRALLLWVNAPTPLDASQGEVFDALLMLTLPSSVSDA